MTAAPETTRTWEAIEHLVDRLYPDDAPAVLDGIAALTGPRSSGGRAERRRVDERDAFLIAYGDSIVRPGERPLRTLARFLDARATSLSAVHILPFFPSTSDDGFSVVDYLAVREDLGTWDDIAAIAARRDLMIDAVLNHVSRSSAWFEGFCAGEAEFAGVALAVDPSSDLSSVVRPRTSPLLTEVPTASGPQWVWTTFSADQIDVNYADGRTLLRVLEVLLEYARRGGTFLRLDAATYMWKRLGTSCASLPETHDLVRLFRAVLDLVSPGTTIITETNVPHAENVSYFGDGSDEAQLVYNFALPPLVLDAITAQDASVLSRWARSLHAPAGVTYFNFLASHDGIGLRGAEGLLEPSRLRALGDRVRAAGGRVSMRSVDGDEVPYELNIGFIDALSDPSDPDELRVARMALAHSIAFTLPGVPAVYIHSLAGSRSAPELVAETGAARSINRARLDADRLEEELDDPASLRARVHSALDGMLRARREEPAFDPFGQALVAHTDGPLHAVRRSHRGSTVWCLHNVTSQPVPLPEDVAAEVSGGDVLVGAGAGEDQLGPWGVRWIRTAG